MSHRRFRRVGDLGVRGSNDGGIVGADFSACTRRKAKFRDAYGGRHCMVLNRRARTRHEGLIEDHWRLKQLGAQGRSDMGR
jgi:hypothetical protein